MTVNEISLVFIETLKFETWKCVYAFTTVLAHSLDLIGNIT